MKKSYVYLISIICCAGLLTACNGLPNGEKATPTPEISVYEDLSVAEGRLVPANYLDLAFNQSAKVESVLVQDGEVVALDQVLARLEGSEIYAAQLASANLEKVQAEKALQKLKDDTFLELTLASSELEKARDAFDDVSNSWHAGSDDEVSSFDAALSEYIEADEEVCDAEEKLDDLMDQSEDSPACVKAQNTLNREKYRRETAYQALLAEYETPKEGGLDDDRTEVVDAIARLESAQFQLKKLDQGPDPDQVSILEARLENAKAAEMAANKGMRDLELRASWAGAVSNWDLKVGQIVLAGQQIGTLADSSGWKVETTDLAEDDVVSFKVGNPVIMTVNAIPGKTFTGKVESIHAKGEKVQGDMTYVIHIQVDQIDPQFYWNMTVKIIRE